MRILVTGGAGYIGSHLAGALRRAGHAVRVLDLVSPIGGGPPDQDREFVRGSLANPRLIAQVLQDVHIVYHLAWSFRAWRFYPEFRPGEEWREVQENLSGTLNMLEAALTAGVRHFLFSSSAVVYGPTGSTRADEGHSCHPERSTLGGPVYGITKLACEKLCLVYQRRGLPMTVFRLHGVFSPGRLGQFAPMIEQALVGQPVRVTRGAGGEYVHMDDVLRAFLLAAEDLRAHGETFNLAGTHTYRDPDLARCIVETAGSESQIDLVEDPTQAMVSVSVDKLRRRLGYEPECGEFLPGLIRRALKGRN